jgi:hypothetical protein
MCAWEGEDVVIADNDGTDGLTLGLSRDMPLQHIPPIV